MYRKKEIYYKKLAHMIVGAGKSPDLQSAHWRPSRAHDVSSSLKTGKLQTKKN